MQDYMPWACFTSRTLSNFITINFPRITYSCIRVSYPPISYQQQQNNGTEVNQHTTVERRLPLSASGFAIALL